MAEAAWSWGLKLLGGVGNATLGRGPLLQDTGTYSLAATLGDDANTLWGQLPGRTPSEVEMPATEGWRGQGSGRVQADLPRTERNSPANMNHGKARGHTILQIVRKALMTG